jgi:outer membrane protein TolC
MKKKWLLLTTLVFSAWLSSGQQSLTLEQALSTALENNHSIAIARNEAEQAGNIARPGNAGMLPTLAVFANGDYSRNNTEIELASDDIIAQDGAQSIGYNASLQLNYTLFNGLANVNTLRQLKELKNVADVNLRFTIENTLLNVTASYYEVARLTEIRRVNEQAILISKDRYDRTMLRSELGSVSKLDLLNAEVNLTADSVSYFRTVTELENAKRNLMVAMSLEPTSNFAVDTTLFFQTAISLEELERSALEQNSRLRIARTVERASQYQLKANKGGYMPQVTLGGAYNYTGQENEASFTRSLQIDGLGLNAGLRWDLFTGYARQTQVRNATLELASNQEALEDTRKQILRDLENAYNTYITALYVMNKEYKNVQTNKLNFARTEELFNLGQVIGTQFREAQLNLVQSESNYSNSRYLAKIAEVELIRIAGLLLGSE